MSGQSGENVKQVQEALKNKGHDPSPCGWHDGTENSASSAREFQKQNGLQATGWLDDKTPAHSEWMLREAAKRLAELPRAWTRVHREAEHPLLERALIG
jgi:peptidoglycan hydrolase-like protein with peptidoglycan-binding domain